jgi:dethiobiotin synthetase
MIPRSYFITGTDTGVGKTVFTCRLARELRAQGHRVAAYKPACSGADEGPNGALSWSDVKSLFAATEGLWDRDRICPQTFSAPLSPPVAAAQEGREVDESLLLAGFTWLAERTEIVLVEGAGGFYSPISRNWLNADLAERIGLQVIIVAPNQLGTINQTLLTIEAVRRRRLKIAGVVLNQVRPLPDASASTNAQEIQQRGQVEILAELAYSEV